MKKLTLLLVFCFLLPCLFAPASLTAMDGWWRMPDRGLEIGLAHTSIGISNDFLTFKDIFQETILFDLDKLKDGFNMNLEASVVPFYFQYNNKSNNWGFGLSFKIDAAGILGLNGSMISFSEAKNAETDVSGAAFVEANLNVYFPIFKLKVKIAPSVFYPVAFIDPKISYTNKQTDGGTQLKIDYNIRMYTPFSYDKSGSLDFSSISGTPGVDLNIGLEFPLGDALGWTKKSKLLNFNLGLDAFNIPLVPAQLYDYMEVSGQIGGDKAIDIFSDDGFGALFGSDMFSSSTSSEKAGILRPFKLMFWAGWQPLGAFLNIVPTVGFSINPFYVNKFSIEYGIKVQLDFGNIFIITYGTGYYDRLWKNSLDIALNFRLLEINFGVDLRSSDFIKSWQGGGLGVNVGLKFGW